jgi:hypothetical protein
VNYFGHQADKGGFMFVQLSDSIIINTDQIVSVELATSPTDFTSEVRITLVGRIGHVTANGPAADNLWNWFQNWSSDYRMSFE